VSVETIQSYDRDCAKDSPMGLEHMGTHLAALRLERDVAVQELEEIKDLLVLWAGSDIDKAMGARRWLIEIARESRQ